MLRSNWQSASPEILANPEMVREFGKVVISQRKLGKKIHGDLLDGQRMMQDSDFVDHDFRGITDQLVSQATSNVPLRRNSSLKKSANRLLHISSFIDYRRS